MIKRKLTEREQSSGARARAKLILGTMGSEWQTAADISKLSVYAVGTVKVALNTMLQEGEVLRRHSRVPLFRNATSKIKLHNNKVEWKAA
jgi:hypothetical protein